MKYNLIGFLLIGLGCIQMLGDIMHLPIVKGIGQATNASPAPKVFTSQNGYETFSKQFYFKYYDNKGICKEIEITPHNYQHLKGPYNRRNMYGATISYSPVLVNSEITKSLFNSVGYFAVCGEHSILTEMGIDYDKSKEVILRIKPRHPKQDDKKWQQEFSFYCGDNDA